MQYSSDIKQNTSNELITINSCGELRHFNDSHIKRYHGRRDYLLLYLCEGKCYVTLDQTVHTAASGDCIL